MSKSYDIDHSAVAAKKAVRAIVARIQGEWDNPALMAQGPLSTNTLDDVRRIAETALSMLEDDDEDD